LLLLVLAGGATIHNQPGSCYVYPSSPFPNMTYRNCVTQPPVENICADYESNRAPAASNGRYYTQGDTSSPHFAQAKLMWTRYPNCVVCPSEHPLLIAHETGNDRYWCQSDAHVRANPSLKCHPADIGKPRFDPDAPTSCVRTGITSQGDIVVSDTVEGGKFTFWLRLDCMSVKQSYCSSSTVGAILAGSGAEGQRMRSCASTKQLYFDKLEIVKIHIPDSYTAFRRRRSSHAVTVADAKDSGSPLQMNLDYTTLRSLLLGEGLPEDGTLAFWQGWPRLVAYDTSNGMCSMIAQVA